LGGGHSYLPRSPAAEGKTLHYTTPPDRAPMAPRYSCLWQLASRPPLKNLRSAIGSALGIRMSKVKVTVTCRNKCRKSLWWDISGTISANFNRTCMLGTYGPILYYSKCPLCLNNPDAIGQRSVSVTRSWIWRSGGGIIPSNSFTSST